MPRDAKFLRKAFGSQEVERVNADNNTSLCDLGTRLESIVNQMKIDIYTNISIFEKHLCSTIHYVKQYSLILVIVSQYKYSSRFKWFRENHYVFCLSGKNGFRETVENCIHI